MPTGQNTLRDCLNTSLLWHKLETMRTTLLFIIALAFSHNVSAQSGAEAEHSNAGQDCSCTDPAGALGDYTCKGGKRYRCRNNVHDKCAWEQVDGSCATDGNLSAAEKVLVEKTMLVPRTDGRMTIAKGGAESRLAAPAEQAQVRAEQDDCAGQWTNYYCYKGGTLYILNMGRAANCLDAYNIFKKCLGTIDGDTVYCNTVAACAPYTICN